MGNELFKKTRNSSDSVSFHRTQNSDKVDNNNPYKNRAVGSFGDYGPGQDSALKIINNDTFDIRSMTPNLKKEIQQRSIGTEDNNHRRNQAQIFRTVNSNNDDVTS